LQVKSQLTPLQVATPLGGAVQALHEVPPQEVTAVLSAH
jgi:hypothetical protein